MDLSCLCASDILAVLFTVLVLPKFPSNHIFLNAWREYVLHTSIIIAKYCIYTEIAEKLWKDTTPVEARTKFR